MNTLMPEIQGKALDPNVPQGAAADPQSCAWVGASAGTGKTKVLTDRVLRLLLPRQNGQEGTAANRILCLTFTKAAANEMSLRINEELGKWAVMDIGALQTELAKLLGQNASEEQVQRAQRLFADVIDCPGGLKIMTIHSFCQSVLGRFPLEADLAPNFQLMEDGEAKELMKKAQGRVLEDALRDESSGSALSNAVNRLVSDLDEKTFSMLVQDVCRERHQLQGLLTRYKSIMGIYAALCEYYDVAQNVSEDQIISDFCSSSHCDEAALRLAAEAMLQDKGKNAPIFGRDIMTWLKCDVDQRIETFDIYGATFLKTDGDLRSQSFPPKSALKSYPCCDEVLRKEGARLLATKEEMRRVRSALMTADLITIGHAVLTRYTALKSAVGRLDFDDLVIKTMELLSGQTDKLNTLPPFAQSQVSSWIMYKLDQGLDHILVDEAQDTNPEQWRIIESLCNDFFSGQGAREDVLRTSFVVGDIKQSIYSFQRAAPEEFKNMQSVFDEKIKFAEQENRNISLDISFRSTKSVLSVVDAVFRDPSLNKAVGGADIRHISHRAGQEGRVELWPVFESAKKEQRDFWDPPVNLYSQESGSSQMARHTAKNIRNWLNRKEVLASRNRPIQPGDIMILVRSRSAFVDQLIRELKRENVPVSGADRMILSEQLAVQDLFAMARFCLCPEDDLTLATILKSPFMGWSEEELFTLAYNRKGSLWQEVCNFDDDKLKAITDPTDFVVRVSDEKRNIARDYLSRLIGRVRYMGAYEYFSHVLNMPCPADAHSGLRALRKRLGKDALDPIEEMLNAALNFGRENVDHMQIFLHKQESAEIEIKREMDEGDGQVRIMTIHGSKGLQAPIVIMPDTIKSSAAKKGGRLIWPSKTKLPVPLYSARKDDDPKLYIEAYNNAENLNEEEYYRLLYVAMTRAADRLYVGGYVGTRKGREDSWYYHIKRAMENHGQCEILDGGILRIQNEQSRSPDKEKRRQINGVVAQSLPDWAIQNAPEMPYPPRPLIPSKPSLEDTAPAMSPLYATDRKRFKRGNITHKLLQFLPDFEIALRRNAALQFVQKNAADFAQKTRESIVSEVMDILENTEYMPFFQTSSMAEVSVTGLMADNRIVSGQIDRLVVTDNEIWIVDYKTNRPPPKDIADVPDIYRKQLRAYKDSIEQIYPNRIIHCALLWTDGPSLMILKDL